MIPLFGVELVEQLNLFNYPGQLKLEQALI
jgi:hypothetical protein